MSTLLPSTVVRAFTPTGVLRASINLGNPILASKDAATGEPVGVSVDLARSFAQRLGMPVELVVFEKAAASVDAVRNDEADIGFFAIDPARSDGLHFTAPYVLIEGSYLVPAGSALQRNEDVDREGTRIAVGAGSAYDLFLTREIVKAQLVRVQGAQGVFDSLQAGDVEVAAGIRQVLEAEAARKPGLRLLPGRFMVIRQAMGTPASRGAEAAAALAVFVEEMKAGGFVAEALARHRIQGASVAPAGTSAPSQA
ncbi:cystine transporter subunit [Variovorax sp. PBL-H6]|uniref:transporter substrate-binding domain-containing protein n=1 Tax=Variovorax sp. PBL-H6 TaxID=434009 RepID=UPI0013168356|nr:transporter substrate-binding domain-containing protein [Variovorax sp. PBL-H6]VTU27267.1 cystine transporter subunit [Variovorax sp. PBL-H6]